jgi:hypothetical protein
MDHIAGLSYLHRDADREGAARPSYISTMSLLAERLSGHVSSGVEERNRYGRGRRAAYDGNGARVEIATGARPRPVYRMTPGAAVLGACAEADWRRAERALILRCG